MLLGFLVAEARTSGILQKSEASNVTRRDSPPSPLSKRVGPETSAGPQESSRLLNDFSLSQPMAAGSE